jgi:hypothetical protein
MRCRLSLGSRAIMAARAQPDHLGVINLGDRLEGGCIVARLTKR